MSSLPPLLCQRIHLGQYNFAFYSFYFEHTLNEQSLFAIVHFWHNPSDCHMDIMGSFVHIKKTRNLEYAPLNPTQGLLNCEREVKAVQCTREKAEQHV